MLFTLWSTDEEGVCCVAGGEDTSFFYLVFKKEDNVDKLHLLIENIILIILPLLKQCGC